MRTWLGVLVLILGLAALVACAPRAGPSTATPNPTPTSPAPVMKGTETPTPTPIPRSLKPSPTPKSTPTPMLIPTPTSPGGEIEILSEEQLREELKGVRFSTFGWKTNFRIRVRALSYEKEFPFAISKDAIPAINNPKFISVQEADKWLNDKEPVQVAKIKEDVRAYPVQILMWHELVNDVVGGEPILITY